MYRSEFPDQVWLGMIRGQWPVMAFTDEQMAARWAAGETNANRIAFVIGPVPIPPDLTPRAAKMVPAKFTLEP